MTTEQLIGWGIKLSIVFIVVGIIGKLVIISLNPNEMEKFEKKMKKYIRELGLWLIPAFSVFFIVVTSLLFSAESMINNSASGKAQERSQPTNEKGSFSDVQQRLACGVAFFSKDCKD